jgi:hypothetical protein
LVVILCQCDIKMDFLRTVLEGSELDVFW